MQAGRFLRTVVHLRPEQVWHRGRLALRRAWWSRDAARVESRYARRAASVAAPHFRSEPLARLAALRVARSRDEASEAVARDALAGRFRFLSVTRELGREVDWYRPDLDTGTRLWKTLLHEFPYAIDLARAHVDTGEAAFRERLFELARSWRRASPIARPGFALDCWNARAVARRLLNWSVAGAVLQLEPGDPDAEFLGRELAVHVLFLRDNLEWDLRGNHLLSDLTALAIGHELLGCAPEALDLLRRQLAEQVLADGCHEELVPMYHAVALQELVELRAVLGERRLAWLDDAVSRMAGFLAYLLPEDGALPLLGDTFHGEVEPRRLLAEAGSAQAAPSPEVAARASGLVVLRAGEAHAVVRAGRHGPDHQMGHAHGDGLSFELSLGRQRIVTDTGTPTYDAGDERSRARSTAAHNTVQIDAAEQIEAWGSFRVGRRGRGRLEGRGEAKGWQWLELAHSGFSWLPGRPLHRRLLALSASALLVLDRVEGDGRHRLRSALHLHPERPPGPAVFALGSEAREQEVSLHERFNESRPATARFLEAEAELPWASGWLVLFAAASEPPQLELRESEGALRLRCVQETAGFALEWRPAGGPRPRVAFERRPPGAANRLRK